MSQQELYGHPIHAFWARLFGGAIGPIVLVTLAVRWLVAGSATLPSRYGTYEIEGVAALALAVVAISGGLWMHLHFLWRPIAHNYWQLIDIGMTLAKLAMVGGVAVAAWFIVVEGFR